MELKFRVWDNIKKTYIEGGLRLITQPKNDIQTGTVSIIECGEHQIIEQYIGLKDKNGKEIYEGDIVRVGNGVWQVIYNEECCQFQLDMGFSSANLYKSNEKEYEVLRNIHENKELLD